MFINFIYLKISNTQQDPLFFHIQMMLSLNHFPKIFVLKYKKLPSIVFLFWFVSKHLHKTFSILNCKLLEFAFIINFAIFFPNKPEKTIGFKNSFCFFWHILSVRVGIQHSVLTFFGINNLKSFTIYQVKPQKEIIDGKNKLKTIQND